MLEMIKALIYGLVSGLSEIVPVSSRGHQSVLMQMFGMPRRDPLLDLLVHLGIIVGVFFCSKEELMQFRQGVSANSRVRRSMNKQQIYENRLLKSALLPLIIGLFFYGIGTKYESNPLAIALYMTINGIILFVPDYVRQSNKNAGHMGFADSFLIGLSGLLCIFPGLSRVAVGTSVAILRGADKQNAFKWLLFLTVPAMIVLIILDIIGLFTLGLSTLSLWLLIGYVLAAAAAFGGSYIAITLMRFLSVNSGFSGFAFYSWGAAAFTFILYLFAY